MRPKNERIERVRDINRLIFGIKIRAKDMVGSVAGEGDDRVDVESGEPECTVEEFVRLKWEVNIIGLTGIGTTGKAEGISVRIGDENITRDLDKAGRQVWKQGRSLTESSVAKGVTENGASVAVVVRPDSDRSWDGVGASSRRDHSSGGERGRDSDGRRHDMEARVVFLHGRRDKVGIRLPVVVKILSGVNVREVGIVGDAFQGFLRWGDVFKRD